MHAIGAPKEVGRTFGVVSGPRIDHRTDICHVAIPAVNGLLEGAERRGLGSIVGVIAGNRVHEDAHAGLELSLHCAALRHESPRRLIRERPLRRAVHLETHQRTTAVGGRTRLPAEFHGPRPRLALFVKLTHADVSVAGDGTRTVIGGRLRQNLNFTTLRHRRRLNRPRINRTVCVRTGIAIEVRVAELNRNLREPLGVGDRRGGRAGRQTIIACRGREDFIVDDLCAAICRVPGVRARAVLRLVGTLRRERAALVRLERTVPDIVRT